MVQREESSNHLQTQVSFVEGQQQNSLCVCVLYDPILWRRTQSYKYTHARIHAKKKVIRGCGGASFYFVLGCAE